MFAVAAVFGGSFLVAGIMVNPDGLRPWGLINYTLIMLVLIPFAGGWQILVTQLAFPTAGRSRLSAVLNAWVGGTLLGVAVIFWISSLLSYDPSGLKVNRSAHVLIPYMPRAGIALGLFTFCQLIACGVVGAIAPILRPETAIRSALMTGCLLFGIVYGGGWALLMN